MTKKDYELIAEVIKANFNAPLSGKEGVFIMRLSEALKNDNPKFNQYIFERKCGFTNN